MNVQRKKRPGVPSTKISGVAAQYSQLQPTIPCTIRCPRCHSQASFDTPFTFLRGKEADKVKDKANVRGFQYGGGFVIEKYPKEFPWRSPENARRLFGQIRDIWGVCSCPACTFRAKHLLDWPSDAYYTTNVRGQALWAWTREEVVALRDFIASRDRKYLGTARQHFWFLRHVPNHFIEVKHRTEVLKKLERLLSDRDKRHG